MSFYGSTVKLWNKIKEGGGRVGKFLKKLITEGDNYLVLENTFSAFL